MPPRKAAAKRKAVWKGKPPPKSRKPPVLQHAPVPVDFEHDADERWVTPSDICAWLQVSYATLYNMQQRKPPQGLPPPIWVGRKKRWLLGSLRKWRDELAKANGR